MYLQRVRPSIERDGAVATLTHGPEDVQQRAAWASLGQPGPAWASLLPPVCYLYRSPGQGSCSAHVSPPRRPPAALQPPYAHAAQQLGTIQQWRYRYSVKFRILLYMQAHNGHKADPELIILL